MKKRILSAIVMTVVFIPILLIGGKPFIALMCLIAGLGLYELLETAKTKNNFPIFMKIISYLILLFICTRNINSFDFNFTLDYKNVSLVIFLLLLPLVFYDDNKKYNITDGLFLIGAVLFLGFSFNLLIITRNYDLYKIIYLLLISIITDTFALITGKLVGRHKLCPNISPNKTIEGLIGGTAMGVIVGASFYHVFINSSASLSILVIVTILLSIVGQLGDLVFSMIKRYYNKKDFSDLIPGHGGILDRFDSLIFIALAFILVAGIL
ncbi:MAG: phosphatidate cytidylyltransferase [Bacilli bacterium]|nr:phosphatidate cytidylyltransferase [Bacilli bacterium]